MEGDNRREPGWGPRAQLWKGEGAGQGHREGQAMRRSPLSLQRPSAPWWGDCPLGSSRWRRPRNKNTGEKAQRGDSDSPLTKHV